MKSARATTAVRILMVEDASADAELVLRALAQTGIAVEHRCVDTETKFRQELDRFRPQVVLSDFSVPGFSGMQALHICRRHDPDIPFIFVSGSIGEDVAVEAMKAGAFDYVMKDNLIRLEASVRRALQEAGAWRARRAAEAGLRRAQVLARLAHVITGPAGDFETWSETLAPLVGHDDATLPKSIREWLQRVHPDDRSVFQDTVLKAAAEQARSEMVYRVRASAGEWVHIRQVMEPLERAQEPGKFRWFNSLQDVTEETLVRQRLTRLNRIHAVQSGMNILTGKVRTRDELFRETCRIAVERGGFPKAWIGLAATQAEPFSIAAGFGADAEFFSRLEAGLRERLPSGTGVVAKALSRREPVISNDIERDHEVLLREQLFAERTRAIAILPIVVNHRAVGVLALNADTAGFFDREEVRLLEEVASDLSLALENIDKAEKIEYLSYYDPLTGLANRSLFHERLQQAIAAAKRDGHTLALVLLDLERFRSINESLGRKGGDALLKAVSERLLAQAKDTTWLARIEADRFALFLPDVRSESALARRAEDRLEKLFAMRYSIAGTELRASARAGFALYPADAADADTLFRNAEAALQRAKRSGERYLFYRQEMTARVAEALTLENKLRQALEKDEFELHYQPKFDLATKAMVGVEALIRWRSPELGLVPPGRFIPLLEETGFILEVGSWALRRAALDHRRWVEQGLKAPRVAVNVSAIQLQRRDFVAVVEQAILEGVAPTGIDLEITESLMMEDTQANIEKLEAARAFGMQIAMDDFGTGYSSLAYLSRLPIHALKIDRSFVSSMLSDANGTTLVQTMISLAHSLKLKVVAEGVETDEQARMLRLLRCDQMQGFLWGKPVPLEEMTSLLASRSDLTPLNLRPAAR